jgi:flap endonuclease-1
MVLTNEAGEVTSHLTGMLGRTIRLMEAGIKPVWVFDGQAPDMKSGEVPVSCQYCINSKAFHKQLDKRRELKAKASAELKEAEEMGLLECFCNLLLNLLKAILRTLIDLVRGLYL